MSEYILLTDSSCDLPPELAEKLGIEVLPLTVTVGGKDYKNYLDGREIGFKDFYARVRGGENAVTAAVNMDTFLSFMKPFLEKGELFTQFIDFVFWNVVISFLSFHNDLFLLG